MGHKGDCFLPFFRSMLNPSLDSNAKTSWFIGSVFLRDYLIVYDNQSYDDGQKFIQIGIGMSDSLKITAPLTSLYLEGNPVNKLDTSHKIGYDPHSVPVGPVIPPHIVPVGPEKKNGTTPSNSTTGGNSTKPADTNNTKPVTPVIPVVVPTTNKTTNGTEH